MRTIRMPGSIANASAQPSKAQASARAKRTLPRIDSAAKADARGAILRRRHQQVLAVLVELVGLREIPVRGLRQVGAPAAQRRGASVLVVELVGPLPYVADQVHHTERTRTLRMRIHVGGYRPLPRPPLPRRV